MRVLLFDNAFGHTPLGYSVPGRKSRHIEWTRLPSQETFGKVAVVTDQMLRHLDTIRLVHEGPLVGWLLEGRAYGGPNYDAIPGIIDRLDLLLTHDDQLLRRYPDKARFVPFGGCWIPDEKWGMHPKTKLVSMIYSGKDFMEGHHLRHQIATIAKAPDIAMDLYGHGCGRPIACKSEGLSDYCYSVVIENDRAPNYFTEKLLDCFALGTVPIYWGAPNIGKWFNTAGIIEVENLDQLAWELGDLRYRRYPERVDAAALNQEHARRYVLPEDYMYEHHLMAFDA